jgi:hypothetical protein
MAKQKRPKLVDDYRRTMTRDELRRVVRETIVMTMTVDGPLSLDQRHDLVDIGNWVKRISWNWWREGEGCGCLIGTSRHMRGLTEMPHPTETMDYALGSNFVFALAEEIGPLYDDVIEVLDAEMVRLRAPEEEVVDGVVVSE